MDFRSHNYRHLSGLEIVVKNAWAQHLDTKSWITLQSNHRFQLGLPWLASGGTEEVRNIAEHSQRTFQAIVLKTYVDQKSSCKTQEGSVEDTIFSHNSIFQHSILNPTALVGVRWYLWGKIGCGGHGERTSKAKDIAT
jgi:hypothetical protein